MSIQRFDPFRDVLSLRDAMSRLFEESFVRPASFGTHPAGTALGFPVDIEQGQSEYILRASLPGFSPEEVNVTVTGDVLTIRAEHRQQQEQNRNYLVRERRVGAVVRTIALPERVQADAAEARFENGELVLTLPTAPENRPTRIQISASGSQQQPGGGAQGEQDAGTGSGGDQQQGAASDQAQVQSAGTQTGPATGPGQHGGQGEPIPQVQEGLQQQGGGEPQ